MTEKRIIPCLDVYRGRVVKGVKFENLKDAGDPVECAIEYCRQGADEIAFLDISATNENRKTMIDAVRKTAEKITVPLTVGGGISSIEDIESVLLAGASKVSINSAAVKNPDIISEAAKKFGSSRIVLALDVKRGENGRYTVLINGGKVDTGIDAVEWAKRAESLGAGEILLTSLDADGTKDGYNLEITKRIKEAVKIPVIASGGCGKLSDFAAAFEVANADAALAASLFHFKIVTIREVKEYLKDRNIPIRL